MFSRLTRRLAAGVMFVLAGALAACGGSDDPAPPAIGKVAGRALASADGAPIAGATVTAGGKTATTAADGSFTIEGVPASSRVVVKFSSADYLDAIVPVAVSDKQTVSAQASMVRAAAASVIDAASNATVTAPNSTAAVDLAASSLVDAATGAAATGNISVRVTPIDPAADPSSMPGDYRTSANTTIESFGAIKVQLQDAAGRKLDLKAGSTATIRIPLSSRSGTPPASIPLFYMDEATGNWVQEGTATLQGTAPNRYYEGTVSHFTFWNADIVADTIFVHGCVNDATGKPVANAQVRSVGIDYSGTARDETDADGKFSVAIRKNSRANIFADDFTNYSNTIEVGPSSTDITLTTCLVISAAAVPPVIVTQPTDYTTDEGSPAYFYVTASGTRPLAYQWRRNGLNIPGANHELLLVRATTAADNGAAYSVVVSNVAGSATSNNATLHVTPAVAPSIVNPPSAASVEAGLTATFSVTATGTGSLSYQWQRNGTNIAGATSSSYTTPVLALGDSGAVYRVVVTNAVGSATSTGATLTVTAPVPTAPSITAQPASVSVTAGQTATFVVTATGSAPLAYQWRKNGVDIAGATSATYTTPATVLADNGAQFTVRVSNAQGNTTSAAATLSVTADSTAENMKLMRLLNLSFEFFYAAMSPYDLLDDNQVFLASAAVCESGSVSGTLNGGAIPVGTTAPTSGTLAATFSSCKVDSSTTYNGSSSLTYNLTSIDPAVGSASGSVTNLRVTTTSGTTVETDYTTNGSVAMSFAASVSGADTTTTFTLVPAVSSTLRSELTGLTANFTAGDVALRLVSTGAAGSATVKSSRVTYNDLRFTVDGVAYAANGFYQVDYNVTGLGIISGSGEVLLTKGGVTVGRVYATSEGVFIEVNGTVQPFGAKRRQNAL